MAEVGNNQRPEEEDEVLDIINKVQMFQIAVTKINRTGKSKGEVFKLADKPKNGQPNMNNFRKHFQKEHR